MLARDVALGEVESVEHLRLLVDRRLGGVEVLRAVVVVEEAPSAEADDLTGDIADGPHHAAAEAVVDSALPLRDEARGRELLVGESLRAQRVECMPDQPLRCVAHAEVRGGAGIEAAFAEEAPCRCRPRAVASCARKNSAAAAFAAYRRVRPVCLGCGPAIFVVQREADTAGKALDGLGERDVVHVAEERVHVAGLAATEAVVETRPAGAR